MFRTSLSPYPCKAKSGPNATATAIDLSGYQARWSTRVHFSCPCIPNLPSNYRKVDATVLGCLMKTVTSISTASVGTFLTLERLNPWDLIGMRPQSQQSHDTHHLSHPRLVTKLGCPHGTSPAFKAESVRAPLTGHGRTWGGPTKKKKKKKKNYK
jgi:hypothetical protein